LRPARLGADFPDPSVVWGGDRWYAFATNAGGRNVQVSSSPDLAHWSDPGDAAPSLPAWAMTGFTWAPTAAPVNGRWVLYVSVASIFTGHCIAALVAPAAGGPYAAGDTPPLVCGETGGDGAIDPFVSIDGGVAYLYWKAEGAHAQQIFGAALTPDGLALAGAPQPLLTASAGWQDGGIENPSMLRDGDGSRWLVYSGAFWATARYAMGYAHCDGPLGPCRNVSGAPWIATTNDVVGPGGGSFFVGPEGTVHLVFHAWSGGPGYGSGGRRQLHIETLAVGGDGPAIIDRDPVGTFAVLGSGPDGYIFGGSASDADTVDPVAVVLHVDGNVVDVHATNAADEYGFTVALTDGRHEVCAVANDDIGQSRPQLGCADMTVSSLPFGTLDGAPRVDADSISVSGWAIDPSTADPIAVDVYVDGVFVTTVSAAVARDDVGGAWPAYGAGHGFTAVVPAAASAGAHTVCAYAVVDDGQPAPNLGCTTVG
jgi:hypothetical protein